MTGVYYKQNRLKKLRAFCQTAKLGSVTRAAEKLFASQPTVSLQIQALEREIGKQLFERRGPQLKLTAEGEILYNLAQPLVQGVDHLQETFEAHCGDLTSGELTIAAGESTILYILPGPVSLFAEQYPGVRLKLATKQDATDSRCCAPTRSICRRFHARGSGRHNLQTHCHL